RVGGGGIGVGVGTGVGAGVGEWLGDAVGVDRAVGWPQATMTRASRPASAGRLTIAAGSSGRSCQTVRHAPSAPGPPLPARGGTCGRSSVAGLLPPAIG